MSKRGKRYQDAMKKIDNSKLYEVKEAVSTLKEIATAKFDETIEVHYKMGLDGRHADQQIRGAVVLPHGTGTSKKVLVIAKGEKAEEATESGADFVGAEDMIEKIQKENWFEYDAIITTPDMMGLVGRLGRVLGPKGLMPNPKSGTVTFDVKKAVGEIKAGKVEYRLDKANIVHCVIGKKSFDNEKIEENLIALTETILKAKPAAAKGTYIKSVSISSSMSPGIKLNAAKIV